MLLTPFSLYFAIIFISATTLCNGETLIEAETEKPTSLSNNSEKSKNLVKSSVACLVRNHPNAYARMEN
uniref:Uncharacterized protein n=1 Tax=Meloidogyne floridensis TaxID=298350 RepID=A0A915P0U0_9BILA